jgi:NAD(P)-dependent dehydrogenase (short-subunit alcohol dehydrogenase family)
MSTRIETSQSRTDRVAVVTGATSAIGAAVVTAFHSASTRVVFVGRKTERGTALELALGEETAVFVAADITVDAELARIASIAEDRFGGVDVLINNAVSYADHGLETSRSEWLDALNVNVVSAALLTQHLVPLMRNRAGAAIVNIGSIGGKVGAQDRATYPASKAALIQLTRNLAATLAADGIRVNSVSPGWTWSDSLEAMVDGDRARADRVAQHVLALPRVGDPEDVAAAVLFLASQASGFITGADLAVDGGFSMLGPDRGLPPRMWFSERGIPCSTTPLRPQTDVPS